MPHLVSFKITDAGSKSKSMVIPVHEDATYTEICAFVLEVDSLLDACLSAVITQASVQMNCPIDGALNDTPAADVFVTDVGLLGFSVTGSTYKHSLAMPGVSESLYDNFKVIADAAPLTAFLTALLGGVNVDVVNLHNEALAAFLGGSLKFRK